MSRREVGLMGRFFISTLALGLCVASMAVGAWLVTYGVTEGDPKLVLGAFTGSVIMGTYYMFLFYYSRGVRFFNPWAEE